MREPGIQGWEGESSHPPVPNVTQCPKVENHVPKNDCLLSINSLKNVFHILFFREDFSLLSRNSSKEESPNQAVDSQNRARMS